MEIIGYTLILGILTRIADVNVGICISGCGV